MCIATSGPGASHLITGLYDARMDHMPVLTIVGQQARAALGGHYQQELPYSGLAITSESLRDYPIYLVSFRNRCADWQTVSVQQVMSELMLWCMDTHLRVALRKLQVDVSGHSHLARSPGIEPHSLLRVTRPVRVD